MNYAKTLAVAAVVLAVFTTTYAIAGPCCGSGGWGGMKGTGGCPLFSQELSKDQQKQVSALQLEAMKKIQPLRAEIAKKRIELAELYQQEKPDDKSIQKKKEEIWTVQDSIRNVARALSTKFESLLTPEQKQKFGGFGPGMGCRGAGMGPVGGPSCCRIGATTPQDAPAAEK